MLRAAGGRRLVKAVPAYSALVIDHFDRPRNVGRFESAADVIEGAADRRTDGAQFVLTARISGEFLSEVRFQAFGCPHCIAAASWLSERLAGADQAALAQWQWREAAVALEVPTEKRGRLLILEDAVRALAENWGRKAENAPRP